MVKLFHGAHVRLRNGVEVKGIVKSKDADLYGLHDTHGCWYPSGLASSLLPVVEYPHDVVEILNKPQRTFNQLLQADELAEGMCFANEHRSISARIAKVEDSLYVGFTTYIGEFVAHLQSVDCLSEDNQFKDLVLVEE
jgi:Xaa-Pro aminopeptidase